MFSCYNCRLVFENKIGLIFGCCPLCGEQIEEDELLTAIDVVLDAAYVGFWKPLEPATV